MIWGFTGFGIAKLTPEQQQEMLQEYDGPNAEELNLNTTAPTKAAHTN